MLESVIQKACPAAVPAGMPQWLQCLLYKDGIMGLLSSALSKGMQLLLAAAVQPSTMPIPEAALHTVFNLHLAWMQWFAAVLRPFDNDRGRQQLAVEIIVAY